MANFPTSLDSFTTRVDNVDQVVAADPNARGSAIVAIENKIGINNSADSTSLDYFLKHASGAYRTHTHDGTSDDGPNIPVANVTGGVATTGNQTVGGIKTFSSIPILPASNPTADNEATRKAYCDTARKATLVWFIGGTAAVNTNIDTRFKYGYALTITKAKAYAKTAPTGANLIFDINVAGTTIWSTQANRLKITASNNEDADTTVFNTTAVAADQAITLDIDQIGAGVAGAQITVILEVTY